MNESTGKRVRFRDVLSVRGFRALWISQIQSLAGDQLARVALSVLVFTKTDSVALTALTYALTLLPAVVGGILFGGLADRYPRRHVMVVCDLLRAALVALMALPGEPLSIICILLVVVVIVGQPFLSAETAILPSLLTGERFVVGSGLRLLTSQAAQLAGFAVGGLVVAAVGVRAGLLINAATFLLSAVLIRFGVPVSAPSDPQQAGPRWFRPAELRDTVRYLWGNRRLRILAALAWLATFLVVPESLAAPYGAALGGGARMVGLLMAAPPAGMALGALVFVRLPTSARERLLAPLVVLSAVPMALCAFKPTAAVSLVLWALLGVVTTYQIQVSAEFVGGLDDARRGQAIGLVGSGMIAVQGLGALAFGLLGEHIGPAPAVGVAGTAALVIGTALAIECRRIPPMWGSVDSGERSGAPAPAR
jgi:MFS family permease